jgi:hypothetical protein
VVVIRSRMRHRGSYGCPLQTSYFGLGHKIVSLMTLFNHLFLICLKGLLLDKGQDLWHLGASKSFAQLKEKAGLLYGIPSMNVLVRLGCCYNAEKWETCDTF